MPLHATSNNNQTPDMLMSLLQLCCRTPIVYNTFSIISKNKKKNYNDREYMMFLILENLTSTRISLQISFLNKMALKTIPNIDDLSTIAFI